MHSRLSEKHIKMRSQEKVVDFFRQNHRPKLNCAIRLRWKNHIKGVFTKWDAPHHRHHHHCHGGSCHAYTTADIRGGSNLGKGVIWLPDTPHSRHPHDRRPVYRITCRRVWINKQFKQISGPLRESWNAKVSDSRCRVRLFYVKNSKDFERLSL